MRFTILYIERDEDAGDQLPFFYPLPPTSPRLPDVRNLSPKDLNLTYDPRGKRTGRRLMRSIDFESRLRHDLDGRTALILGPRKVASDHNTSLIDGEGAVEPGSVLLVEQISSRSSPRTSLFAGVLVSVKRKGITSSFTLRNYVLGTGVEMVFPLYSPMVTRIKVLKRAPAGFAAGRDEVNEIRARPSMAPLSFSKIDDMVLRDKESERIRAVNRA